MGQYRVRDLFGLPSLVSLLRLPLAIGFALTIDHPTLALLALVTAAFSDVLDGFLARRLGQATATGAVVDGVLDKGFAAVVILTLILHERLTWGEAVLLGTRELGELPLVLWWSLHRGRRRARAEDPRANWLGKLVTVLQFLAIALVLPNAPLKYPFLLATGLFGVIAAAAYWRRELRERG